MRVHRSRRVMGYDKTIASFLGFVAIGTFIAEAIADLSDGQEDINAACSPRGHALSDRLVPDGRLPAAAAPTLDTQREER